MINSVNQYFEDLEQGLQQFPKADLAAMIEEIGKAYEQNRTIFVMGNGGSASTASHFAADLNKNVIPKGRRPRVIALTDNVEALTAWGNDSAYEDVFLEQLINFYNPGDVVVAISASGSSPNIIKAVEWAKEQGSLVIGLTGPKGAKLKSHSDVCVMAPTAPYELIEDFHVICMHTMVTALKEAYGGAQ